ncbi:targeting protein for Xklp2-like [Neocloeon triangulifer]|uniref:targeting protein for Xklp2-like n=1 Tax=Neocloeon triangulifer TaxID=2078957 RepID=UPI00286F1D41|nr:targeting protein for Xklp2-like [Neocloeon triangulifer]
MEIDQFDNYDAPQFFDFSKDVVPEDCDRFFDVDHERVSPKRASSLPPKTPAKTRLSQVTSPACLENKENCTPPSKRRRSSSVPPSGKNNAQRGVLSDISYTTSLHASGKKSQVTYLSNGRSVIVQKYDGIQIMTPNKTHPMETRLDLAIKSPALSLRNRSICKGANTNNVDTETSQEKTEEAGPSGSELMEVDSENEQVESSSSGVDSGSSMPEVNKQPVITKGRSVVVLPSQLPSNSTNKPALAYINKPAPSATISKPAPSLNSNKPAIAANKPMRIRHNAPMVAQHNVVLKPLPKVGNKPGVLDGKFHATAELVQKFHKATPDRFHSVPANAKPQPRKPPSPASQKGNTIPKSPYLACKTRVRNEYIPSQVDKEKAELEEIKMHQIKAKPVPRQILVPPAQKDIAVAKIPATKPSPFKLSEGKRKMPTPEPVYRFKANPVPRRMLQSPQGVPEKKNIPLTEPHTPALSLNAKYPKRPKLEGIDLKKIGHNGVPIVKQMTPHKLTQVQPFSFEERNKEIQLKRMELMQKHIEEEKQAREFKAGKKPNFGLAPVLPEKKPVSVTVPHTPKLSTYTLGAKNQQKFYEKMAEEEQKLLEAVQFKARPAIVTQVEPFRPQLPHRVITDITSIVDLQLNTEKRAAERAKFDEILRANEQDREEQRRLFELMKEEELRKEEMRLRKEAEFRANPIRKGTPMRVRPSDKPLTDPQSPNFMVNERLAKN